MDVETFSLIELLEHAALTSAHGITFYPTGRDLDPGSVVYISYRDLRQLARENASRLLSACPLVRSCSVVLLHFDNARDTIVWFWTVIFAGAIPAISAPSMFSNNPSERTKHVSHLHTTLQNPFCLTRQALVGLFENQEKAKQLKVGTIEGLESHSQHKSGSSPSSDLAHLQTCESHPAIAVLMLTSGSSGNSKAVQLTHGQILAAVRAKADFANPHPRGPFLSWIGVDHVANLTEIHLHAMLLGVSQIQVSASDISADPLRLLNLVSRHGVSRTFAPNFVLAKLRRILESGATATLDSNVNLNCLEWLGSGGEANVVEVCVALQESMAKLGARKNVIVPGFGMTETCAGCVYNDTCPSYDRDNSLEFTALGRGIPGLHMRITQDNTGSLVNDGEIGNLEVAGDMVFKGYYNNKSATKAAFTSDGWFRTGDLAFIDSSGHLHLTGRTKDVIVVNGVKYMPSDLEASLNEARIPGASPSYFCCFSVADSTLDTERIVVVYSPAFDDDDKKSRFETQISIIRTTSMLTRCHPLLVPLPMQDLPKSTLGKLSRAKLQKAFENGEFDLHCSKNDDAIEQYRLQTRGEPASAEEAIILEEIRQQLEVPSGHDFSVNDSIFSFGASSMDLMAIVHQLKTKLSLPKPMLLIDILNNPSARGLAKCIASIHAGIQEYEPVVVLQSNGHKQPLWLVHPGVGEVLVFLNLAQHITDRPVYGFRARGFTPGETPFQSIEQIVNCYVDHMKRFQPRGPYAIAGYSYGSMIAFEIAKRLESQGEDVRYCGCWNLPPHIKFRMQQLDWAACLANLFYFVSLLTENTSLKQIHALRTTASKRQAIDHMKGISDSVRWAELGLTEDDYLNWADIAVGLQGMAREYEPSGNIKCMDVFVANPLQQVAANRADWIENKLRCWEDFVRDEVRFHDVEGEHYTILSPMYVSGFAGKLRKVLTERGI